MSEVLIRNNLGKIVGKINIMNERQELRTFGGRILGYYDPKKNVTTNYLGSIIGYGNLLSTLITEE